MGKERIQTYERRLLDALFLTNWNLANYGVVVWNIATVDAQGVIIRPMVYRISTSRICKGTIGVCCRYAKGLRCIYHIGVGSDVVCSTTIGNARASVRGMDKG